MKRNERLFKTERRAFNHRLFKRVHAIRDYYDATSPAHLRQHFISRVDEAGVKIRFDARLEFPFERLPQRSLVAGPAGKQLYRVAVGDDRRAVFARKRLDHLQRQVAINIDVFEHALAAGVEDEKKVRGRAHDGVDRLPLTVLRHDEIRLL